MTYESWTRRGRSAPTKPGQCKTTAGKSKAVKKKGKRPKQRRRETTAEKAEQGSQGAPADSKSSGHKGRLRVRHKKPNMKKGRHNFAKMASTKGKYLRTKDENRAKKKERSRIVQNIKYISHFKGVAKECSKKALHPLQYIIYIYFQLKMSEFLFFYK